MKGRLLLFLFSSLLLSLFIVRFAIWGFLKKRKGLIYGIVIMMSYELIETTRRLPLPLRLMDNMRKDGRWSVVEKKEDPRKKVCAVCSVTFFIFFNLLLSLII